MGFLRLPIPQELKEVCHKYLKTNNMGKRGRFDGNAEQQLTGLIGEVMTYEHLLKKPYEFKKGFDDGVDFVFKEKKFDVKTMGRTVFVGMDYVNNLVASQVNYESDVLIFCSLNKKENVLEICGWITKKLFIKRSVLYEKGSTRTRFDGTSFVLQEDMYEIKNGNLCDIIFL